MAFWAYLLRCADDSFYAGHTDNLDARIAQHLAGKGSDFTARRQPLTLVWSQDFASRIEALEAEHRIKGWSRAKKAALIAGDWALISQLASFGARPSTSSGRTDLGSVDASFPVRPEFVEGRAATAPLAP
ncbi:GIY-YIG nuclease family protein [Sphingomonas sp. Y38-1Y]|uniref:GIY-YIG nuclease family protein n=1 Tax=Sphingomonas sp. Y38-1Y TaxID=3078265 RepID=UPI0028EE74BB|nr:GIY-YIG nuclease family protein [Sphingomonas sp. Y38-1Y]